MWAGSKVSGWAPPVPTMNSRMPVGSRFPAELCRGNRSYKWMSALTTTSAPWAWRMSQIGDMLVSDEGPASVPWFSIEKKRDWCQ